MDTFGQRLVASREKRNLSQKELAELLGITPTRLNYWEKDKREPAIEMIKLIAQVLDLDTNYLIGHQPQNKKSPSTAEAAPGEDVLKLLEALDGFLVSMGYISADEDLTEQQQEVLIGICRILRATFEKK